MIIRSANDDDLIELYVRCFFEDDDGEMADKPWHVNLGDETLSFATAKDAADFIGELWAIERGHRAPFTRAEWVSYEA